MTKCRHDMARSRGADRRRINRKLRGWSNYFRIGTAPAKPTANIDSHVRHPGAPVVVGEVAGAGSG